MKRKAWLALAAGPFLMSADLPPNSSPINSGYPPVRYMGEAIAIVFFANDVEVLCGAPPPGYQILACASADERKIAMPNPCAARYDGEQFAKIMCHEKGHILGWPATHGD